MISPRRSTPRTTTCRSEWCLLAAGSPHGAGGDRPPRRHHTVTRSTGSGHLASPSCDHPLREIPMFETLLESGRRRAVPTPHAAISLTLHASALIGAIALTRASALAPSHAAPRVRPIVYIPLVASRQAIGASHGAQSTLRIVSADHPAFVEPARIALQRSRFRSARAGGHTRLRLGAAVDPIQLGLRRSVGWNRPRGGRSCVTTITCPKTIGGLYLASQVSCTL